MKHEFGVTDEDMEKFGGDVDACDKLVKRLKEMMVEEADRWHHDGVSTTMKMTRMMTALTMLCGDMLFASASTLAKFGDEDKGKPPGQIVDEAMSRIMEGAIGIARLKLDLPVISPQAVQGGKAN